MTVEQAQTISGLREKWKALAQEQLKWSRESDAKQGGANGRAERARARIYMECLRDLDAALAAGAAALKETPSAPTRTAGERTVTVKNGIYHSEHQAVTIHGSAIAGVIDGLGGDSGAIRIDITDHEIMDMAISGQAYSLDGRFNFKNRSPLLDAAWAARSSSSRT